MQYCIGNIRVAFAGDSAASRVLQDTLRPIGLDDASSPELRFQFVDRLPGIEGVRHTRIGRVHVGDRHVQMHESLWHYDISQEHDTLNVLVVPRPEGPLQSRMRDLKKSWRYLHRYGRSSYLHRVRAFCFSGYVPMVQLALLNHGATFCHSSAIERDGQAILFPACGGVGKTSLMSRYVEQGWNFLADDLCTLDARGRATIHPLPMHIYKYHEIQAAGLVRKMLELDALGPPPVELVRHRQKARRDGSLGETGTYLRRPAIVSRRTGRQGFPPAPQPPRRRVRA